MTVSARPSDDELALWYIMTDPGGCDSAEFLWDDPEKPDGCFRCHSYQIPWWRTREERQIDLCVAEGSMVLTDQGEIPIEQVVVGTMVWTHKNRWRPVSAVHDRGYHSVVRVATDNRVLKLTPDHKIYTLLGDETRWIEPEKGLYWAVQDPETGPAWEKIVSVMPAGVERTYDLTVTDDNSFTVSGGIVSNCGRDLGKSLSIAARCFNFAFRRPGQQRALIAPELNHLNLLIGAIEARLMGSWLTRQMMRPGNKAFTHRPFECVFLNGSTLEGRIPQRDGRGLKGVHAVELEIDEGQDLPEAAYKEVVETVKRSLKNFRFMIHGVTRGVHDTFYRLTQPGSGYYVHHIVGMHRPTWTDKERQQKIEEYGGIDSPDYRRNVLGAHGDEQSALFPLVALMACQPAGSMVWLADSYAKPCYAVPIEQLNIGDAVANAFGSGVILNIIPSDRDILVRIDTGGGAHSFFTPEHRLFTARGWVEAGSISRDDLIFNADGVRQMLSAACESAAEVLLEGVCQPRARRESNVPSYSRQDVRYLSPDISNESSEAGVLLAPLLGYADQGHSRQDLSDVWDDFSGYGKQDLLHAEVCWARAPEGEHQAKRFVSVLQDPPCKEGWVSLLQPGVLERLEEAARAAVGLPGVREALRDEQANSQVLLQDLFLELGWQELSGVAYGATDLAILRNVWRAVLFDFQED